MADRTISSKVAFVNYSTNEGVGGTANPGEELDLSILAPGEEERIEKAGGFADTPLDPTTVGNDLDGHTLVDDREPTDTETPVPVGNGGVEPLDDEVSDYEAQSKSDLEELAESRNLEVEGTGSNGAVTKSDLVQALDEDDRS